MEDRKKQIQTFINSRTGYVGHVTKVSNKINDLIENCEYYKKLDHLQDQLMTLSEKIKDIHNHTLELVQCPDHYQTCQEYYFNENSRIIDLVLKIQSYVKNFLRNLPNLKEVLQNHLCQVPNLIKKTFKLRKLKQN